ncbi:MAG: Trm112 family protein [Limisphaerales bacterium]
MEAQLLKILRCPETRQELRLAEPSLIGRLNRQIAAGALRNRAGQPLKEQLQGGLVRADGKFLYPIRREIPVMLIEEALPLEAAESGKPGGAGVE